MFRDVVVYSPDRVRGQVLSKALAYGSIPNVLAGHRNDIAKALDENIPSVLVYDAKVHFEQEIRFLRNLVKGFALPLKIILLIPEGAKPGLPEASPPLSAISIPDPLAPEYVLVVVKEALTGRKKEHFRKWRLRRRKRWLQHPHPIRRFAFQTMVLVLTMAVGLTAGFVYWALSTIPDISQLAEYVPYETSKLYDSDHTLLAELFNEKRTNLPPERIPDRVKQAFVAAEDEDFYEHKGIDLIRVFGALFKDIRKGDFVQGGSTITQQLVKMLFLKPEKTLARKIQEAILSLRLEKKYSKEEILGYYLNLAYFGTRSYGVEAAAETYFGKPLEETTLAEAALLAAIPKAPSRYSPFKNPERTRERRDYVLQRMVQTGAVTPKEAELARAEPLPTVSHESHYRAPYFVDYCRSILEQRYGDQIYGAGMQVYTTLDYRLQQIAEQALDRGLEQLGARGISGVQAALIAIELGTGRIRAMIGGTNFWKSRFNRAVQAQRQPGSAFKPVVYLTALARGFKPGDEILDTPPPDGADPAGWMPHNFDDLYHGAVSLEEALTDSLNSATVNLAKAVQLRNVIATAQELGIRSPIRPFYPSAIGASELNLLELVAAYAAFATGRRTDPVCLDRIVDKKKFIQPEPATTGPVVIEKDVLASLNILLRSVVLNGTAREAAALGRPVFGKTGTTNDYADAWFVGYDDKLSVGVWVGRDNHQPIGLDETGARAALPIWLEFMKRI